jgi:hypothetical protein
MKKRYTVQQFTLHVMNDIPLTSVVFTDNRYDGIAVSKFMGTHEFQQWNFQIGQEFEYSEIEDIL